MFSLGRVVNVVSPSLHPSIVLGHCCCHLWTIDSCIVRFEHLSPSFDEKFHPRYVGFERLMAWVECLLVSIQVEGKVVFYSHPMEHLTQRFDTFEASMGSSISILNIAQMSYKFVYFKLLTCNIILCHIGWYPLFLLFIKSIWIKLYNLKINLFKLYKWIYIYVYIVYFIHTHTCMHACMYILELNGRHHSNHFKKIEFQSNLIVVKLKLELEPCDIGQLTHVKCGTHVKLQGDVHT